MCTRILGPSTIVVLDLSSCEFQRGCEILSSTSSQNSVKPELNQFACQPSLQPRVQFAGQRGCPLQRCRAGKPFLFYIPTYLPTDLFEGNVSVKAREATAKHLGFLIKRVYAGAPSEQRPRGRAPFLHPWHPLERSELREDRFVAQFALHVRASGGMSVRRLITPSWGTIFNCVQRSSNGCGQVRAF